MKKIRQFLRKITLPPAFYEAFNEEDEIFELEDSHIKWARLSHLNHKLSNGYAIAATYGNPMEREYNLRMARIRDELRLFYRERYANFYKK